MLKRSWRQAVKLVWRLQSHQKVSYESAFDGEFFVKASLRLVHTGRGQQHPGCICAKTLCKMELVSEVEKENSYLRQLTVIIPTLPCAKVLVSEYITIGLQEVVDVLLSLPTIKVI